jgi:hypothetical protein
MQNPGESRGLFFVVMAGLDEQKGNDNQSLQTIIGKAGVGAYLSTSPKNLR